MIDIHFESNTDLNDDSIITKAEFKESYYVQKIPQEHREGLRHQYNFLYQMQHMICIIAYFI